MQQATVGSKYQIVIPKEVRNKVKGLKPGSQVMVKRIDKETLTIKTIDKGWINENYGKYKKYLKDGAEEVEKMRNEWEERLTELEGVKKV